MFLESDDELLKKLPCLSYMCSRVQSWCRWKWLSWWMTVLVLALASLELRTSESSSRRLSLTVCLLGSAALQYFIHQSGAYNYSGVCKGATGVLPPMAAWWSTINNIIVSWEAILSAENNRKPLGGEGCTPNPAWRAHITPPDPLTGARGLAAPPKNPTVCLGLRLFGLAPMKTLRHAVV